MAGPVAYSASEVYIGPTFGDRSTIPPVGNPESSLSATLGFHVLRLFGLLADDPSYEGLWFAERVMREMHMAQKPRISLDPEKVVLITAVLGLLDKIADIVIKAVSYDRRYPQLLVQV
ncbi:hypothetical protein ASG67_14810 [Sphingomonas sp. Leaf339]|nr:hypothetical protein ASG67_14810 [Sphingomonas sp. Leaf339]